MIRSRVVILLVSLLVGSFGVDACDSSGATSNQTSSTTTAVAGKSVDVVLGSSATEFTVAVSPALAAAGDVTFAVRNAGKLDHELIVLKTDTAFDKLPIVDAGDPPAPVATGANKVDEANSVGETGDPNLKPGELRSFTITGLAAGHYVLLCNLEGHYGNGMRAAFTVS